MSFSNRIILLFVFILGMSVLYMLFLAFALFQTREDFRKILFFFDPKLESEGPDTKVSYKGLVNTHFQ